MQSEFAKQKPVIFLAFANDKEDNARYLRNLPKELDGLRKALLPAVQAGLCEVVERASATIEQMLDTFQDSRYKDRIAIFHYGGHADGYQLLLEQLDGSHGVAHGAGLVSFFAKQKGLKLVFFNGCSTQQQTLELVEAGVPAVIGTSSAIGDDIATNLSIRFYNGIAHGLSIDKAWLEAIDYIKIQQGYDKGKGEVNTRGLFRKDKKATEAPPPDRLPWDMYYKQGAEIVKDWNLPEAVDNPLFGLPDVSQMFDLPETPYRFLERYKEEHTEIFFGRSYYIRDLYTRATDRNSAPIILLYGQSGVGKSSLLDAGVLPRLEQVTKVVYVRRNQDKGMLGTLKEALGMKEQLNTESGMKITTENHLEFGIDTINNKQPTNNNQQLTKNEEQETFIKQLEAIVDSLKGEAKNHLLATIEELKIQENKKEQFRFEIDGTDQESLRTVWKLKEREFLQPFIVILDQAEEVFTRPNEDLPNELEEFLAQVSHIFGNPKDRPVGKLILSYRKEYSAEFDESFKKLQLPREGIFLKHLERRDIVEVITGLTLTPSLKNKYRLNIEPELPIIIADDLLEDKDSPIAPILQILLTKMWKLTEEEELRYFSVKKYQQLKKEGILMNDFFHQQMAIFRAWSPSEEVSGFALDILNYHTTLLGTAGSRRIEDIKNHYAHRIEMVEPILQKFQELYLLSAFSRTVTGLAHDTLAPVIQIEYRSSDRSGQRAARVLENRIKDFEANTSLVLDETDLEIVENGYEGMRLRKKEEEDLVKASSIRRDKLMRERKRNRLALRGLGVLIALLLVVGFIFQQRFTREIQEEAERTKIALKESEVAKRKAVASQKEAEKAKYNAQEQSRLAQEQKVVAERQTALAKQESEKAIASAKIAEEQKLVANDKTQEAMKQQKKAELASVEAMFQQDKAKDATQRARRDLFWFNSKELAVKSKDIQSEESKELKSLLALSSYLMIDSAFAKREPKRYSLETLGALQDALLNYDRELDNEAGLQIKGEIKAFALNKINQQIAYSIKNKLVIATLIDDEKNYPDLKTLFEINLKDGEKPEYIRALAFSPDGEKIAVTATDGDVYLIPAKPAPQATFASTSKKGIEKRENSEFKPIYRHRENVLAVEMLKVKESIYLVSTGRDTAVYVWDLNRNTQLAKLRPENIARCFTVVGQKLYAGLRNGSIVVWDLNDLNTPPAKIYQDKIFTFFDIEYIAKKNWLAAGTDQGELLLFNLNSSASPPIRLQDGKHTGVIYDIAVSPDSRWVATAGLDNMLKLWDLSQTNKIEQADKIVPLDMPNKTGQVLSSLFDAQSQYLLFGDNQKMQIRSIDIKILFEKLKKHLKDKQLTNDQWEFYIKGDLKKPKINY
jgi:WD40 repeat protein